MIKLFSIICLVSFFSSYEVNAQRRPDSSSVMLMKDLSDSLPSKVGLLLVPLLAAKANTEHNHTIAQVTDLQNQLNGKQAAGSYANATHGHVIGDIPNLQTTINGKADISHAHTKANITDFAHSHIVSDITGLQAALDAKANTSHAHAISDVSGLQTALDAKGVAPIFARVTGSNVTTTGQALVDVTGLSVALAINAVYEFEANLSVQSSSTAGNQYGVNYSAAGATIEAQISGTLAAATARADRINALNTAAPAYVTSGATGGIKIQGIITTGANAGNLTIKHFKTTSGTSTVFINSYLKVTRIQ